MDLFYKCFIKENYSHKAGLSQAARFSEQYVEGELQRNVAGTQSIW